MSHLKGLTGFAAVAAACTAMTWGNIARAATPDQDSTPAASTLSLEQPITPQQTAAAQYLDDATPPTPWTLQGAIDKTPVGQALDKYKLTLNMFVEASYLYDFRKPAPGYFVPDRVFDVDDQHLDLNQADIQLARAVTQGTAWDYGGLIEVQYGRDARFIHSAGLDFYKPTNPTDPPDQFDLTQAYVTVNAPVGTGLVLTAGKFVALQGYETINPTANALYSHSYSFGFAIPFTNTGLTGEYQINNQWTATVGFVRGWDQALKSDTGDALNIDGQLAYTSYDVKGLKGYFNFISGPASPDIVPDHVNRYWRTVVEGILSYAWGDNWTFATDAVFGFEPHAAVSGGNANWYGDALYATYKFNSYVSATGRGEYFNDDNGARGIGAEVYEATAGVEVSPFPNNEYLANLLIRPEFREDWSSKDAFNGKANQATVAADLIYKF